MKRTISILLAALVLLVALPAFAEGEDTLQPGLYIVEGPTASSGPRPAWRSSGRPCPSP